MSNADVAADLFKTCNCAQAVLSALGPQAGLGTAECFRVAAAFGGGMMVLGLRHGGTIQEPAARGEFYGKVQDFAARFARKHGSTVCRELIGCDLGTSDGQKTFNEKGLHAGICTTLVRSAVEILEEMEGGQ